MQNTAKYFPFFGILFILSLLNSCGEETTTPSSALIVEGVLAEGAYIEDGEVTLRYVSKKEKVHREVTSRTDTDGNYSIAVKDLEERARFLRLKATYSYGGGDGASSEITLRSYVDLREKNIDKGASVRANINQITEFAFNANSVGDEDLDEEKVTGLNRVMERISKMLDIESDFRTTKYTKDLDAYQEVIKFRMKQNDISKIEVVKKRDDQVITEFSRTVLTDKASPEAEEAITAAKNRFSTQREVIEEIDSQRISPIPRIKNRQAGMPLHAVLRSLSLSGVDRESGNVDIDFGTFTSGRVYYRANVENSVKAVTIMAEAGTGMIKVENLNDGAINPDGVTQIPLNVGRNVLRIIVIGEHGGQNLIYTIHVERRALDPFSSN